MDMIIFLLDWANSPIIPILRICISPCIDSQIFIQSINIARKLLPNDNLGVSVFKIEIKIFLNYLEKI